MERDRERALLAVRSTKELLLARRSIREFQQFSDANSSMELTMRCMQAIKLL
jgi:hypothetical protein